MEGPVYAGTAGHQPSILERLAVMEKQLAMLENRLQEATNRLHVVEVGVYGPMPAPELTGQYDAAPSLSAVRGYR